MCFFPGHTFLILVQVQHQWSGEISSTFQGERKKYFLKIKSNFSHLCYISFCSGLFLDDFLLLLFANIFFISKTFFFAFCSILLQGYFPFKYCQVQPTPLKPYAASYSLVSKKMNTCFCITLSSKEVCYTALFSS